MTIYRCTATGVNQGLDSWTFGLHVQKVGGSVAAALTAWQSFMDNLFNGDGGGVNGIAGDYSTHLTVQSLVVTALDALTGKNSEQAQSGSVLAGTAGGDPLPGEVACCVSLRTSLPTRAGRGRFYLPNPNTGAVTAGVFNNSFVSDVVEAAQYGLDNLVTATYVPIIYHASSITGTTITSVDVGSVPDVQRRRRNKLTESRQSLPVS